MFKQAERRETDGQVEITRSDDGYGLVVSVTNAGVKSDLYMSEFNASRVFGMLAMLLEIPLSKSVGKAIKL